MSDAIALNVVYRVAAGVAAVVRPRAAEDAVALMAAAELELALMQVLRIALDGEFDAASATPGLKGLLARAGDAERFEDLEAKLQNLQMQVRAIFEKRISAPG